MENVLQQLMVGLLGILLYNLIKFRPYLKMDRIKTKVFWSATWQTSKFIWGWTILVILVLSGILYVLPEASEAIKTMTALDLSNNLVSFFTLGWALSGLVDSSPSSLNIVSYTSGHPDPKKEQK